MIIREYTFVSEPTADTASAFSLTIVSPSLADAIASMNRIFNNRHWTFADLDRIEEYLLPPLCGPLSKVLTSSKV